MSPRTVCGDQGLGFRVQGSGFTVGFRSLGLCLRVEGSRFRVYGLGVSGLGLGFRVLAGKCSALYT